METCKPLEDRLQGTYPKQLCWWRLLDHIQTNPFGCIQCTNHRCTTVQYNEIKTWIRAFMKHYQNTQWEIQTCIDTIQINGLSPYFCLKPCFPATSYIPFKETTPQGPCRASPASLWCPSDTLLPPMVPSHGPWPSPSMARNHIFHLFPRNPR